MWIAWKVMVPRAQCAMRGTFAGREMRKSGEYGTICDMEGMGAIERILTAALACGAVACVMAWLALWLREHGLRPLRRLLSRFCGLAPFGKIVAAVAVCLFTLWGGSKEGMNGGGGNRGAPVPVLGEALVQEADPPGFAVTDLCFTAISPAETSVFVSAAWPTDWLPPLSLISIFARHDLASGGWEMVADAPVPSGASAVDIEIPHALLPEGGESRAFFALGTYDDTDTDGIPDTEEILVWGTDPDSPDTDGDGISDGDEIAMGTDPLAADTDGDGLEDYLEIGGIVVEPNPDPFFEGSVLTNLTDAILANSNWCVTVELQDPIPLLDETFTHLSVDMNGLVYLRKAGDLSPLSSRPYCSSALNAFFPANVFAVAAYWSRLSLSAAEPASSVTVRQDFPFTVVEYSNMRLSDSPSPEDNLVSFQVILPTETTPYFILSYETSGTYCDGRLASIGACGRNGAFRKSYCYQKQGRIADGMMLYVDPGYGSDPLSPDTDGDGLTDGQEANSVGTDPLQPDTDRDGLLDGWEVSYGLNPLSALGDDGSNGDPDQDGLANIGEYLNNCNPQSKDSDGDGVWDLTEIEGNSNPADVCDGGVALPTNLFRTLTFNINGDYAAWEMTVEGIGPADTRIRRISMGYPNAVQNMPFKLRKGGKYRLSMRWLNSDGHNDPDWYCWQAKIDGLPGETTYGDYSTERKPGIAEVIRGNGWVADNTGGLLTGHVHQRQGHGGNVAGSLTATLYVLDIDVAICAPSGAAWVELEPSRVVLDNEQLRVKAEIRPSLQSMDECRRLLGDALTVRTAGTCPEGAELLLGSTSQFESLSGHSVLRAWWTPGQLKSLGLLPQDDEDGINEMAWLDIVQTAGQSYADSEAFAGLGYQFRGKATSDNAQTLESTPPNSVPSESFFKAAGCEVVSAEFCGFSSPKRQIVNQADIFYYSGHGHHDSNDLGGGFTPAMAVGKWNADLGCVILAGCSVLDINDYNNNYIDDEQSHHASPGKAWEQVGPGVLLGYNYSAPGDSGGAPTRIVQSWVANRGTLGDVEAWMKANEDNCAWNACAIVKGQKYVYFKKIVRGFWIKRTIEKKDW